MAQKKKIMVVAGARPNFIKINLLVKRLKKMERFRTLLIHTGQHYDFKMSRIFFQDLGIPEPDRHLNASSKSLASDTARIMTAFEALILKERPALVIVAGDVNSTLACSLAAAKQGIKVAHIEAGLRSFDTSMPEEMNRVVTDSISDLLFVSEEDGLRNLKKEGIAPGKIHFVGNTMIDTLLSNLSLIERSAILKRLKLDKDRYAVLTLHRPSNVDSKKALLEIHGIFSELCRKAKLIYPVHPRARRQMEHFGLFEKFKSIQGLMMIEPLGYIDFMKLVKHSLFVLTDSGGIQEETTVLNVPCITMRENTERPVTIEQGTNLLVGRNKRKILLAVIKASKKKWKKSRIPKFWDGKTSDRIVKVIKNAMLKGVFNNWRQDFF